MAYRLRVFLLFQAQRPHNVDDVEITIPCQLTERRIVCPPKIATAPSQPMHRNLKRINKQLFLARGEDAPLARGRACSRFWGAPGVLIRELAAQKAPTAPRAGCPGAIIEGAPEAGLFWGRITSLEPLDFCPSCPAYLRRRLVPASSSLACRAPPNARRDLTGFHEIKHDGYRLMARRDSVRVRLRTRNGHDWSPRFPLIVEAASAFQVTSFLINGEAERCDDNGLPVFEKLRSRLEDRHVFLSAFDLLELNGQDLRRKPIKERKRLLAKLIRNAKPGLREDIAEAGDLVFRYACELGLSGEPFMGAHLREIEIVNCCPSRCAQKAAVRQPCA